MASWTLAPWPSAPTAATPMPPPASEAPSCRSPASPRDELTQLPGSAGCVRDASAADPNCPDVAAGLNGALSVAVSPDGRNVYVASINVGQVATFSRDPSSGALSQLPGAAGCVQDVHAQPDSSCPGTARGIHGARWVTVSPDGRNVYVTSPVADSVAAFARDQRSGALAQLAGDDACVRDVNQLDPVKSDCPRTVDGLKYPRSLAISPDGTNVVRGLQRLTRDRPAFAIGRHRRPPPGQRPGLLRGVGEPATGHELPGARPRRGRGVRGGREPRRTERVRGVRRHRLGRRLHARRFRGDAPSAARLGGAASPT